MPRCWTGIPVALLAAVAGLEEATLRHGLARLVEAEILFSRGAPPDTMYTFKHALVQEAAYDSLLKRTRQQLHGRVVDVLMATFPERAAAEPELSRGTRSWPGGSTKRLPPASAPASRLRRARLTRRRFAISAMRSPCLPRSPRAGNGRAREIPLQLALGESLGAARGLAHIEVGAAFERARVLVRSDR